MYRGVFETDAGHFEHLFNSPNIPHTTTVLQICFYFPDPGKEKPVEFLRNKSMLL